MTLKDTYKELRKKLKDDFVNEDRAAHAYHTFASVGNWVRQSGMKPSPEATAIICNIFGSVPYPYQPQDRAVILKFLKENKFKDYKKWLKNR